MNLLKKFIINTFLIFLSLIFIVTIIEYFLSLLVIKQDYSNQRYMLFKSNNQNSVFRNIEGGFVYQPNIDIENTTFFHVNNQWVKEFDYIMPTNNFGLVQTQDLYPKKKSILLLGDSYTEGVGAYPWFEKLNKNYASSKYQFINGGIFGTGFESWFNLYNYLLSQNIEISKIVIIFTSDDYRRGAWNMHMNTLKCIENYKICKGDENFYGKPSSENEIIFLEKLRNFRNNDVSKLHKNIIINYIKKTYPELRSLNKTIRRRLEIDNSPKIAKSNEIIKYFINKYEYNALFIHIPTKFEVLFDYKDLFGKKTFEFIEKNKGNVVDAFGKCNFKKEDFHIYDGHPNAKGYNKISICISSIIEKKLSISPIRRGTN